MSVCSTWYLLLLRPAPAHLNANVLGRRRPTRRVGCVFVLYSSVELNADALIVNEVGTRAGCRYSQVATSMTRGSIWRLAGDEVVGQF